MVLTANGIGRAVQQIRRGESSGELAINVARLGVHHITDAYHRGGRQRAFVDAAENHTVAVAINEAGRDVHPLRANHDAVEGFWRRQRAPHLDDAAIGDADGAVGDHAFGPARPNRRVLNNHILGRHQRTAKCIRRFGNARSGFGVVPILPILFFLLIFVRLG